MFSAFQRHFKRKSQQQADFYNPFLCFDDDHHYRSQRVGQINRQNVDIDSLIDGGEEGTRFIGKSLKENKVARVIFLVYIGLIMLLGKSFYLQVVHGQEYRQLAERNRIRTDYETTTRGTIYDRNGKVLVKNSPEFFVSIIPSELPFTPEERWPIYEKLGDIIELWPQEIEAAINEVDRSSLYYYQPIVIKEPLKYDQAIKIVIADDNLPGVHVQNNIKREYLNTGMRSLSHILGYTGKINAEELEQLERGTYLLTDAIGKTGIEKQYELELKGAHGIVRTEVDAFGREKKVVEQVQRRVGSNIVLTIDADLQEHIEKVTREFLVQRGKHRASVVAMNPQNGEVLAMVSLPTYDNNVFAEGIKPDAYKALLEDPHNPLFSRSVSGEYPSGSTFKMVMAAAGLQEGVIKEYTTFLSAGGIRIGEWFFPDWKAGGHGVTDVRKALAESVNTFFYILGGGFNSIEGLGVDAIQRYAYLFGLGRKLGIDIPGERDGFLPTREWKETVKGERWYVGDTYHFSIGQGDLLVTPLQVAAYTAAVANGGAVYQPHLVKEVINPNDNNISAIQPKVIESGFIDDKNIQIVRQGLRQGVTNGSGRRLSQFAMPIAGKTGTAQWSRDGEPHSWFTSFAPYDNPELALTILVEEGGDGSDLAVKIAEQIYRYWIPKFEE